MSRKTRIGAIGAIFIVSWALASCQALSSTSSPSPKASPVGKAPLGGPPGTTVQSAFARCTLGAQTEALDAFDLKMTGPTSGWALGQCTLGARPSFSGGSTVNCMWPQIESMGILRTTDGGATWTDMSPPSVPNRTWHHAQYFLDATHAWVAEVSRTAAACVTQVTTYGTADGGRTWQQLGAVPVKTAKPTDDVFNVGYQNYMDFVDPQHGWLSVVSPGNPSTPGSIFNPMTLYATTDGGLHWRAVATNPGSAALGSIAGCQSGSYFPGAFKFMSAAAGWLLVSCPTPAMLMTQDGGATWRPRPLPADCTCEQLYQPVFLDASHAIITGERSPVMLTTGDAGATWAQRQLPAAAINQFSFIDPDHGWLVSILQLPNRYETAVSRTADGGRSWSSLGKPGFATNTANPAFYYPISSVQFVSADVGFVVLGQETGAQGAPDPTGAQLQLIATEDGGRTWKTVLRQVPTAPCSARYQQLGGGGMDLSPVKLVDAATAWARGGLRTTDGGAQWRDTSSPGLREGASTPLYPPGYVDFYLDGDHGWQAAVYGSTASCSDHVSTFATSDGGKTWQQSAPVAIDLPSGYETGSLLLGFSAPASGWLWVPMGTSQGGWGPNSTEGSLYRSSDGGLTWRHVSSLDISQVPGLTTSNNCQPSLGQVVFASASTGWMTINCLNSGILATHDGGLTWKIQSLPASGLPTFVDEKHGFIEGYNGKSSTPTLMSTSDGGATWHALPALPGTGFVMGLTFADATNLWALVPPPGWSKVSGGKDSLYHSADGGQTWSLVQSGLPIGRAYAALFVGGGIGMVAEPRNSTWAYNDPGFSDAFDTVLAVTSDGGHSWKIIKPAVAT